MFEMDIVPVALNSGDFGRKTHFRNIRKSPSSSVRPSPHASGSEKPKWWKNANTSSKRKQPLYPAQARLPAKCRLKPHDSPLSTPFQTERKRPSEIKRRAKKNLIIRPVKTHTIHISVPPCGSVSALNRWLGDPKRSRPAANTGENTAAANCRNPLPEHIRVPRQLVHRPSRHKTCWCRPKPCSRSAHPETAGAAADFNGRRTATWFPPRTPRPHHNNCSPPLPADLTKPFGRKA